MRRPFRPWLRPILVTAGLLCLILAVLGVFLPLLPATPFLLLAAACFARSSERLHAWMLRHPRFGPILGDWESQGAIRPGAKRAATVAILISAALTLALTHMPRVSQAAMAASLVGVLAFIWTRPDGTPDA
ncbi:MAG: YbaN family protein [Geothrix sp.]|nr:YbaN family protein [Geothrix sp.]